jgi:hypothetical protein
MVWLECTLYTFKTDGFFKDPGPFSSKHKALLIEYLESVDSFTKWLEFYQACKFCQANCIYSEEQGDLITDISQTDIGQCVLNFSSSPIKQ